MSNLISNLHFKYCVTKRFLDVMPRKKKNIKFVSIHYAGKLSPEENNITLRYKFRNAVWYKIGSKKTTESNVVIQRPTEEEKVIDLTVYGVFRRISYSVILKPESVLINREA